MFKHHLKSFTSLTAFTAVLVLSVNPFLATPAAAPTPVTPSATQVTSGASCGAQYNNEIIRLDGVVDTKEQLAHDEAVAATVAEGVAVTAAAVGLIAKEIASTARAVSFGVMAGALLTSAAVASIPVSMPVAAGEATALAIGSGLESVALGLEIAGQVSDATAFALEIAGLVADAEADVAGDAALALRHGAMNLPLCDTEFDGTVTVNAGGLDVAGTSRFKNDLGVDGTLHAAGDLEVHGISKTTGIVNTGTISSTDFITGDNGLKITSGGANITGGINNNSDGITNVGTLTGVTGIDVNGDITATGTIKG
jgi:hypothetical protein